ncbi:MAG: GntR family transcriptional regulator [Rhodobacteraceae bacterium]|nr:GntR family transcriptional regulator [Paracoccaceae bacterium]
MDESGSNGGGQMVHERAGQFILDLIKGPGYRAGDRIPSERDLSEQSGISRMTMRKAISHLVDLGVLERRGTAGTFLPTAVIRRPMSDGMFAHGISEIVRQCGGVPGSKLLVFERHAADLRLAERLGIRQSDPVVVMRRLRTVNGQPFCIETTHMADARVPGLVADDLLGKMSFYEILRERYGIRMYGGEGLISMTSASPREASLLELGRETSCLLLQAVSLDVDDRPMEFLHSINHPRMVEFRGK